MMHDFNPYFHAAFSCPTDGGQDAVRGLQPGFDMESNRNLWSFNAE
jgi:hypothetical protein